MKNPLNLKWFIGLVVLSIIVGLSNGCSSGSSDATSDTISSSDAKSITSFLLEASENSTLSSDIIGTINETEKTVQLLIPWGNSVTNLIPLIEFSGVSIDPASGIATDYTNPVTYTVTAENGSTQDYIATASSSVPFNAASGISFTDGDQDGGELSGDVTIIKADDESDITYYALYWGSDATTKLFLIQTYLTTGSNLTHPFASDTAIPEGATYLLVFTGNDIGEMETAVSTIIVDALSWAKSFDSAGNLDKAYSVQQTTDQGYIVAGNTWWSMYPDGWIMKLDSTGDVSWQKKFGVSGIYQNDEIKTIQQTASGGYIAAGYTGLNGDKDFWVLKLDSTGEVIWQNTYGGKISDNNINDAIFETAQSIMQTDDDQDGNADDGFIVAGYTYDFPSSQFADYEKMWLIKINAEGGITWQKSYGGTVAIDNDRAYSVQQTSDGGYILAGQTGVSNRNIWVLKLDSYGNITWQKSYGGSSNDYAFSIKQTAEGGYIVAGTTFSFGAGNYDIWVLRLDAVGNVTWEKTFGGSESDWGKSIRQTDDDADGNADDGFIVAGYTVSFGAGSADIWVLKLNTNGDIAWQNTYGGTGDDYSDSIFQTADGGYIIAGTTNSFDTANGDFWLLKIAADGSLTTLECGGDDTISISDTSVVPSDSSATVATTLRDDVATNITEASTDISGTDTSATIRNQCY